MFIACNLLVDLAIFCRFSRGSIFAVRMSDPEFSLDVGTARIITFGSLGRVNIDAVPWKTRHSVYGVSGTECVDTYLFLNIF